MILLDFKQSQRLTGNEMKNTLDDINQKVTNSYTQPSEIDLPQNCSEVLNFPELSAQFQALLALGCVQMELFHFVVVLHNHSFCISISNLEVQIYLIAYFMFFQHYGNNPFICFIIHFKYQLYFFSLYFQMSDLISTAKNASIQFIDIQKCQIIKITMPLLIIIYLENIIPMIFEDLSDKVSCPYNKNHIFDKQKLIFHINRCKDKQKVGHLYASCQYNRIHILPKEDIQTHEMFCNDKDDIKKLTSQLKQTLNQMDKQRERSREKVKKEQNREIKSEVKVEHGGDHIVLDECPLCSAIIEKFEEIKKIVPQKTLSKIKLVQKIIKKNKELTKAQQQLQNR